MEPGEVERASAAPERPIEHNHRSRNLRSGLVVPILLVRASHSLNAELRHGWSPPLRPYLTLCLALPPLRSATLLHMLDGRWRYSMPLLITLLGALALPRVVLALPPGSLRDAALAANLHFGAAVDTNTTGTPLALAASEFTSATAENSMKWTSLSPSSGVYDFSDADAFVSWATTQSHRIRGHTLFWSRGNGLPSWLAPEVTGAPDPQAALTQLMQTHAATVVGRYAGQIAQWDVVNEPLGELSTSHDPASFFYQTLGESYLDIAFNAAHTADPSALLFLNETAIANFPAKLPGLIAVVEGMLSRGVPIHGVGLQGHFIFFPPDVTQLRSALEALAALGVVVEFTEVDIRLPLFAAAPDPLAAQADAYEALTALCLDIAACTGITVWGIHDGDTWLDSFSLTAGAAPNRPLLFDAAYAQKPAYDGVVAGLQPITVAVPGLSTHGGVVLGTLLMAFAGLRVSGSTRFPKTTRRAGRPAPYGPHSHRLNITSVPGTSEAAL